jgi:hypothetical protein
MTPMGWWPHFSASSELRVGRRTSMAFQWAPAAIQFQTAQVGCEGTIYGEYLRSIYRPTASLMTIMLGVLRS